MSQNRQRQTSPTPGNDLMALQVIRSSEPSTEVNMDPVSSILGTRGAFVAKPATVALREVMTPERREPPPPTLNMPSSRDRNANPPETSTKVLISLIQIS